jgi:hypothetical protein
MLVSPRMRLITLALALAACGGPSAEAPLTVSLGLSRDAADKALAQHQYCKKPGLPAMKRELYPRCDRAGSEWGDSWVLASFDGDHLVELARYERYSDDARAVERWNALVTARSEKTPPSDEALQDLRTRGLLEGGTRAVKAFREPDGTVVGVYLLTPTPPDQASILEKVTYTK